MESKNKYWQQPDRKVTVGAIAGGLAAVLIGVLHAFWAVEFQAGFEAGLTVLIMAVIQYFTRNRAQE